MNYKISFLLMILLVGAFASDAAGQIETQPQGVFNNKTTGVKFLDAYFGTSTTKMEVGPGDKNVPLTVVFANTGSNDIVGIKGQIFVPADFSSPNGKFLPIFANSGATATAGSNFELTFFIDISKNSKIKMYPATVVVDYSRLRETGVRNDVFNFSFMLTGESIVNLKAITPIITSITNNNVILEISNSGSSTLSNVDVVLQNTATTSSTSVSTTNIENVIFDFSYFESCKTIKFICHWRELAKN